MCVFNVSDLRDCHLLQVLMRIESDEHIFKFLKAKFGYGIGRYCIPVTSFIRHTNVEFVAKPNAFIFTYF